MSKFKVGDRVVFIRPFGKYSIGDETVVWRLDGDGNPVLQIPGTGEDEFWPEDLLGQYVAPSRSPSDPINSPPHYQSASGIECIDAIRAALTPEEFRGYCKGNAIKYVWRERMKGGDESLGKAEWYLNRAAKHGGE